MSKYKVTQTWGPSDGSAGIEASPVKYFDTLDEVGQYIVDEKARDALEENDIIYELFEEVLEPKFIRRQFKMGIQLI